MSDKTPDDRLREAQRKIMNQRAAKLLAEIRQTKLDLEMRLLEDIDRLVDMGHAASEAAAKFHLARLKTNNP